MTPEPYFWEVKTLQEMSPEEWEALCDGCGTCCLYKLEDEDTGEYFYTHVACRFLDLCSVRCKVYPQRQEKMPTCITLTPETAGQYKWLPDTCAYRRLAEGRPLPAWHPLVSGDPQQVHRYGRSVKGMDLVPEAQADLDNLEDYIIGD